MQMTEWITRDLVTGFFLGIVSLLVLQLLVWLATPDSRTRGRRSRRSGTFIARFTLLIVVLLLVIGGSRLMRLAPESWHSDYLESLVSRGKEVFNSFTGYTPRQDASVQSPVPDGEIAGRVTRVIDGDTFELRTGDQQQLTIRLHGIDAPEYDQSGGAQASRLLARKIDNRNVTLTVRDTDRYGRTVAVTYYQGRNVNVEMVSEGAAWWYVQYAGDDEPLREAQKQARENQIGIWAEGDPVPPWDWRQ